MLRLEGEKELNPLNTSTKRVYLTHLKRYPLLGKVVGKTKNKKTKKTKKTLVVKTALGTIRTSLEPGIFNDGACIKIKQKVTVRTSLEHNVPRAQRP